MRLGFTENALLGMLHFLDDIRPIEDAAVGDRRNQAQDLKGRDTHFLSHGDRANGNFRPSRGRLGQTALLAGKIDSGQPAESESFDVAGKTFFAQPQPQLDRTYIGGILHDLADR